MQNFMDLKVWKKAHELVLDIYRQSAKFPADERFGLTSQLRRSVASTPANIAEGSRRDSNPEFAHFLNIAQGSLAETSYHLILARDLGYLAADPAKVLLNNAEEVAKMLNSLRTKVLGSVKTGASNR